ncbi:MAG: penicillin-binding protein, partial [Alicyclobacillus sp.]|nr:penicillin-binding protein [Alicyclobacillus sp.]
YTPTVVCAAWVGYDDNRPLTTADAHLASLIWAKFMGTAQQRRPSEWFQPPQGLVKRSVDPVTGEIATPICRDVETDYFLPGTEPTNLCRLHAPESPRTPSPKHGLFGWLRSWLT